MGGNPLKYIDPAGLLTVLIWDYRGSNDAWGHTSMLLDDGTYISWWPDGPRDYTFGSNIPIYEAPAFPSQTYADDFKLEVQAPNHTIYIKGLDEAAIKKWWLYFKKKNKWKTFSQNCSSTVAEGLDAGGGGNGVYWSDWRDLVLTGLGHG